MVGRYFRYVVGTFILLIIQSKIVALISLEGITPDILILWIVFLALAENQLTATIAGFLIGLSFDFFSGSFIGLSALAKTCAGFAAGYFFNENKTKLTLGSYRFLLIVLISSLVHNCIYSFIFTRGDDISLFGTLIRYAIPSALYTAAIALLPVFVYSRQSSLENV